MVNLNAWSSVKSAPPKKGMYLLLCGTKPPVGGWMEIHVDLVEWNGHVWNTADTPFKWKYHTKIDDGKYYKKI